MGDVADLTAKAYEIVRKIPHGMVTSYGELGGSDHEPQTRL